MSHSLTSPSRIDLLAYRLRSMPIIHRVGFWLRRVFWNAVKEAFWEFARQICRNSPQFGPPAKTFSTFQALRCGWPKINGRIVLHDQGTPRVTAESLLARSGMGQHAEQPWPIFWSQHTNARLVSESLAYISPAKELCVESVYGEKRWRHDKASRFLKLPSPVKLNGNWTSIVSLWVPTLGVPVYGHWLLDALPRLALLPEFPPDTRILVPAKLAPYQKETLELLGIWDRCRPTAEEHVTVENYYFSSPTTMIDCYSPHSVKFLREAFLPRRSAKYSGPKKFFMRRSSKRRAVENIDEICDFFRSKGWEIVNDVNLTFAETVKLFSEAEAVCSNLGSNLSNAIFCPPGCTVMHLVPDVFLDGWLDWIAETNRLNYHVAVFPCGGPKSSRIVIEPKAIQDFFDSSGVSF